MASDYPKRHRHPTAGVTRRHPDDDLTRLIRFCGLAYGFSQQEISEAIAAALDDHEAALICFRSIAAELEAAP